MLHGIPTVERSTAVTVKRTQPSARAAPRRASSGSERTEPWKAAPNPSTGSAASDAPRRRGITSSVASPADGAVLPFAHDLETRRPWRIAIDQDVLRPGSRRRRRAEVGRRPDGMVGKYAESQHEESALYVGLPGERGEAGASWDPFRAFLQKRPLTGSGGA